MKKISFIKLFAVVLAAALSLCSCAAVTDSAQQIASAVVSSANAEISSALSEGMAEFSEGMDELHDGLAELTSALNEVSQDISSANMEIAGQIDSVAESISEEVSSGLSEAVENIVSDNTETTTAAETDISEETTAEPDSADDEESVWYTFRNKARYDEHYEKHGAEFGNITKEEYLQKANDLINSRSDRVLHKYSDDGDYMYFDQDTGYFLVLSADGYIRTFFIPTAGIKYWNRQ